MVLEFTVHGKTKKIKKKKRDRRDKAKITY